MDLKNNLESINKLKEKLLFSIGKKLLVRVANYDDQSCADFDYIPVAELIFKLENNELVLRPDELDTFIEV
jgi:hypothetical protein